MTGNVLFFSGLAGAATLAGVGILRLNEKRALRHAQYLNSFAAGIILALALFHLIPEAVELFPDAMLTVGLGFLVFYLLEALLVIHSGVEIHYHASGETGHGRARSLVTFTGLFFHSLIDGVVIGLGFEVSQTIGLLASLSVILHEFPEGTTSYSLLLGALGRKKALNLSIAVALATPAGAALSLFFLPGMDPAALGTLLAFAAGTFLYIGASDLVPETHGTGGIRSAVFLAAGGLLIYAIGHFANLEGSPPPPPGAVHPAVPPGPAERGTDDG